MTHPVWTGHSPKYRKSAKLAVCALLIASLSGCSWSENRTEEVGTVVGGLLGAVIGSKIGGGVGRDIAMVLGGTLGAFAGHDLAKELTNLDKRFLKQTTADALEYGKPGENTTWSNPNSGHSGTVSANDTYINKNGENCREFETTIHVDGESQTSTATACRSGDGGWRVVDEPEAST
ncbi:RT0821/Lpp0805 family surface protein [Magnetovibrio sp. PR-2]|uniref:RT0821/Lpp0805 family surface protein n=1 Tax=Magnetovibrio sp. PR-2 TaxID=3120356 RepID=UPI002FCE2912